MESHFNPRIPYGMRLEVHVGPRGDEGISIHASRMGCDVHRHRQRLDAGISIHASRMGCDPRVRVEVESAEISIHASRMGCDPPASDRRPAPNKFQSTHPVWDATARMDIAFHNMEIFARSSS